MSKSVEILTIGCLSLLISLFCVSCEEPEKEQTPYQFDLPSYFPSKLNVSDDNPMTVEGVRLGRHLFYDGRLSGRTDTDSMMCCATCHCQENSFDAGIDNPLFPGGFTYGLTGIRTNHVTMPLVNLVFNHNGYTWNGSLNGKNPAENMRRLEDMLWIVITAEDELCGDTNTVRALFQSLHEYSDMFEDAFGTSEVTVDRMGRAIAQFVNSIVSCDSKFDRYLKGEEELTEEELLGYELFMTEDGGDCFHCHGGAGIPLFTTNKYYNNGKDSVFTDENDRFKVTLREYDKGAYRAPSLRNLKYTAPYMHDGRYSTIDDVLDFYNSKVLNTPYTDVLMHHAPEGGVHLTPSELSAIKSFLMTLTDESVITNEKYSNPW